MTNEKEPERLSVPNFEEWVQQEKEAYPEMIAYHERERKHIAIEINYVKEEAARKIAFLKERMAQNKKPKRPDCTIEAYNAYVNRTREQAKESGFVFVEPSEV